MSTVSELIAYLQTLPPGTEVEVLEEVRGHYVTSTEWGPLDLGEYSDNMELYDFTADCHKASRLYGKRILSLGGK